MLKFFLILFMFITMMMIFIMNPMMVMMMMIIQTLNVSFMIGLLNKSFWFSYIIFLVMIGGLMILFMYLTSLISNNLINFKIYKLILILTLMIMTMLILFKFVNINMININTSMTNNSWILNSLMKIYNNYTYITIITIMNYLFITLLISTKIMNLYLGPLRN